MLIIVVVFVSIKLFWVSIRKCLLNWVLFLVNVIFSNKMVGRMKLSSSGRE